MPRRQPRKADKNPLHDSALRIGDVHIGRSFIMFNVFFGVVGRGQFLSVPFAGWRGHLEVRTNDPFAFKGGHFLEDMGIVCTVFAGDHRPFWNPVHFTIDARKDYLLPVPLGGASDPYRLDDYDYDYVEYYDMWQDESFRMIS